jgi:pimeloyl-ACP methyl ester carboxylesterase
VTLPDAVSAGPGDLPDTVRAVLDDPPPAADRTVEADGIPFFVRTWGDPGRPALLLLHGVTSNSGIWWRVGPALATALETHVVAPDQAGHGRTGHWAGKVTFAVPGIAACPGVVLPDPVISGTCSWAFIVPALQAAGGRV